MKPVAILGVGPAGLMAAHACAMNGVPVALFSRGGQDDGPIKSVLGGAQFLHEPIAGFNDASKPDTYVRYINCGTAKLYRQKVYGDDPTVPFVSMEQVGHNSTQAAWNLRATYDQLWDAYVNGVSVNVELINPQWIDKVLENDYFSFIMSTIPAPALCRSATAMLDAPAMPHRFGVHSVNIAQDCVLENLPDDHVVYDGTPERSWYRCSKLFGVGGTEWPASVHPPYGNVVKVKKPIATNCNCYEGKVLKLGRHGKWKKGVLTHHAFQEAFDALQ